jgi:ribosome biogenesis GTP-binding protein YsxC/EngB
MLSPSEHLFAGLPCDFIWGAASANNLPDATLSEIAFAGRSNVGKSSLINALTRRKDLAKTSNTPGRTQQLNFFKIRDKFLLVDMPGYGYAKVSKTRKAGMGRADFRLSARARDAALRAAVDRFPPWI